MSGIQVDRWICTCGEPNPRLVSTCWFCGGNAPREEYAPPEEPPPAVVPVATAAVLSRLSALQGNLPLALICGASFILALLTVLVFLNPGGAPVETAPGTTPGAYTLSTAAATPDAAGPVSGGGYFNVGQPGGSALPTPMPATYAAAVTPPGLPPPPYYPVPRPPADVVPPQHPMPMPHGRDVSPFPEEPTVVVSPEEVMNRVRPSVVLVIARTPSGVRRGTGFIVGPNTIVTCAHTVQGSVQLTVRTAAGGYLSVTPGGLDSVNDIAVLRSSETLPNPLRLRDTPVREREPVAVTGYTITDELAGPYTRPISHTVAGSIEGFVSRDSPDGHRLSLVQVDADISPGHSGGPVYCLRDGTVVGMVSFRVINERVVGFAITVDNLRRALN